jgi:CRISPR-associated protein Csd1
MSWIQKLYETYGLCAGILPPISHTTQQAHIEVVIDGQGQFRRARVVSKEDCTTLVPCTESSGGRSGRSPVNHPLSDKLQYVAGDFLKFGGEVTVGFAKDPNEPHRAYVAELSNWVTSSHAHPKLSAVLAYVQKRQTVRDLVREGILLANDHGKLLKEWSGDKKQTPPIFKALASPQDAFVRWKVETPGNPLSNTWEDQDLLNKWIAYYAEQQTKRGVCMVTGTETSLAKQHPSKLRNAGDKAKLISSNDNSGFTFRGRFRDADEACSVGFEVTQKAHIALRWLIGRQGYRNGDQVIVSWEVSGRKVPDPFANSFELFEIESSQNLSPDEYQGDAGQAFGKRLSKLIAGYRAELGSTANVVVMGVDSASKDNTGRLAIIYYRELTGSEFLDRIQAWHVTCAWAQNYSKDKKFVGAPSPKDIAESAFGHRLDDKLRKATVERLLPCIIDGRSLPRDIMDSTVRRTCNRVGLERWEWERNLGIACALVKNFFKEREYQMTLETDRATRDYLYGRLLAIAESIESFALTKAEKSRDTTASRLMQRFSDRPYSTWRNIELALTPYKSRLRSSEKSAGFLFKREKLLDEVLCTFQGDDFTNDRTLSGEFLLGYHCQRRELNQARPSKMGELVTDDATATDN